MFCYLLDFNQLFKVIAMQRILIIDDEKSILDVLHQAFTHFGYSVEIAADGSEGIQKFDNGTFDLVITDVQMPGLNGNEVAHYIRRSQKPATPVIGISGTQWLFDKNNFDLTLPKPFSLTELHKAVKNLFVNRTLSVSPN